MVDSQEKNVVIYELSQSDNLSLFINGDNNYNYINIEDPLMLIEQIKQSPPDLIVFDLFVKRFDPFSLKVMLDNMDLPKPVLYILLAFNKDEEIVRKAHEVGIFHIITKPVIPLEIKGLLERHLKWQNLT